MCAQILSVFLYAPVFEFVNTTRHRKVCFLHVLSVKENKNKFAGVHHRAQNQRRDLCAFDVISRALVLRINCELRARVHQTHMRHLNFDFSFVFYSTYIYNVQGARECS